MGKRVRKATRKKRCQNVNGTAILAIGKLGDTLAPDRGYWTCDTSNGNSWESLHEHAVMRSKADIILAQETRLKLDDNRKAAFRAAERAGWTASLGLAHRIASDRASGGCGVMARKGVGAANIDHTVKASMQHRIHHAWVGGVVRAVSTASRPT